MQTLLLIVLTSSLFQEALGSDLAITKNAILRSAVYETTRKKCYSSKTKNKFPGLGWSLKEGMQTAKSYLISHKLSEDQFRPDPKIVQAYAEHFCETLQFPTHGKLPPLEVLNIPQLLEDPTQQNSDIELQEISTSELEETQPFRAGLGSYGIVSGQGAFIYAFVFLSGFMMGAFGMQSYSLRNDVSAATKKLRRPEL
jgi:hypothetical protein